MWRQNLKRLAGLHFLPSEEASLTPTPGTSIIVSRYLPWNRALLVLVVACLVTALPISCGYM
jgi:hypothetical protein